MPAGRKKAEEAEKAFKEVRELVTQGYTNKSIHDRTQLDVKTVRSYRKRIEKEAHFEQMERASTVEKIQCQLDLVHEKIFEASNNGKISDLEKLTRTQKALLETLKELQSWNDPIFTESKKEEREPTPEEVERVKRMIDEL